MRINKKDNKPAILLGNGLNNYPNGSNQNSYSWKDLLCNLSTVKNTEQILKSNDLSYPEFFDTLCFLNGKYIDKYKTLKPEIVKKIREWKNQDKHTKLVDFARKNNIPIITTNYDTTLLSDELLKANKKITKRSKSEMYAPQKVEKKPFTDFYPWFSYYSDKKIKDATKEFAIWQMHGFWFYKRSLSIGASDYASNIFQMKRYIYNDKNSLYNTDYENWIGRNSWLDIFLNNDLYIIGLTLDSQETSIRWLLMEREKYFLKNKMKRRNTYYVNKTDNDSVGIGKKYFFDTLHITIISKEAKEIYDKWEIS